MGDEARSDVALTIAMLVLGPLLLGPLRGGSGAVGVLLDVTVLLALTTLVPVLLARSRAGSAGIAATFGFRTTRFSRPSAAVVAGLPSAIPVALAGAVAMLTVDAGTAGALLGRLSGAPLQVVQVAGLAVGGLVLPVFLARRGAEAFPRSPEWSLRRLTRTLGLGASTLALVAGLVRVPLGASPVRAVVNAAALAVLVIIVDRTLIDRRAVPRLALLLPAGLAISVHVAAFGLGVGLQAGALAAGTTVVMGVVALSTRGSWPLVPLTLALHVWPTCLSPLALTRGLC